MGLDPHPTGGLGLAPSVCEAVQWFHGHAVVMEIWVQLPALPSVMKQDSLYQSSCPITYFIMLTRQDMHRIEGLVEFEEMITHLHEVFLWGWCYSRVTCFL